MQQDTVLTGGEYRLSVQATVAHSPQTATQHHQSWWQGTAILVSPSARHTFSFQTRKHAADQPPPLSEEIVVISNISDDAVIIDRDAINKHFCELLEISVRKQRVAFLVPVSVILPILDGTELKDDAYIFEPGYQLSLVSGSAVDLALF